MSMPQSSAMIELPDSLPIKGEEGPDTTTLTTLQDDTIAVSKELLGWAKEVTTDYVFEVIEREKELDIKDRGNLSCYAHRKKETLPVYVEWATFRWSHSIKKGKLIPMYRNLKKPARGWSYNINTLMKHALPEALESVQKTEHKFTAIRRINHHLTRTRFHLREALKAERVLDGAPLDEEPQDETREVEGGATIASLLESTVVISNDLLVWAGNAVKNFQDAIKAQEQRLQLKEKSKLNCRATQKNDSLPVYVEWSSIRWERLPDNTAKPFFNNIKKPARGWSYTINTLKKYTHSDSLYLVEEAEEKFAAIRKINHHLSRIRFHLGEALKAEAVLDGTTQEISADEQ